MRLLTRTGGEDGFSVVELVITLSIFAVLSALVLTFLTTSQTAFSTHQSRWNVNSQARLALEQLDREVRSGSVVRDPATESPPNYILRVLTQANNQNLCVQWRIEQQRLERRQWDPSWGAAPDPTSVSGWRVVAESIVNAEAGVDPFTAAMVITGQVRTVSVVFVVDEGDQDSMPVRVSQSLSARNTAFNFPQPPPGPYVGTGSEPCNPEP